MVAFHDLGSIMANNYCVATVLTFLPKHHLTEAHRLALCACNVAVVDTDDSESLYLFTRDGEGPCDLELPDGLPLVEAWEAFLEETGLDGCSQEPFTSALRECMGGGGADWTQILQLVLRALPDADIPHIDVQGSYWCDKERRGEFGGFALRVTRTDVVVQESAQQFFDQLDRRQQQSCTTEATSQQRSVEQASEGTEQAEAGEGGARVG